MFLEIYARFGTIGEIASVSQLAIETDWYRSIFHCQTVTAGEIS